MLQSDAAFRDALAAAILESWPWESSKLNSAAIVRAIQDAEEEKG